MIRYHETKIFIRIIYRSITLHEGHAGTENNDELLYFFFDFSITIFLILSAWLFIIVACSNTGRHDSRQIERIMRKINVMKERDR